MLEIILLALILTAAAGLWDLKTTEVPDEIPAVMIIAGLGYWFVVAAATGNFEPLILSAGIGTALLAVGLLLYKKGQWGGADAWILAAIGYMLPLLGGEIFMVNYLMNFFIIAAAYMIIYALLLGAFNPTILPYVKKNIHQHRRLVFLPIGALLLLVMFTISIASMGVRVTTYPLIIACLLVIMLVLFWCYGKVIEERVFKKRIPVAQLRPGDVLLTMNWVGLTAKQVADIKKKRKGKYVTIKEGIRFVPAFFITLAITLLWGNILLMFMGI